MILMSPSLSIGKSPEERAEFLRKADILEVKTFATSIPEDWTDVEVEEARKFLDEHGMRVGEFSRYYKALGGYNLDEHELALQNYRRQLRHARIIGASCVGFGVLRGRGTPHMWSQETWEYTISVVAELVREAEAAGVDVAAHPHLMSPICSVERYKALLEAVGSPRLKILMDIVNLTEPHMVFRTTELINKIFDELGDAIITLHAKDVMISGGGKIVVHIDEAVPGAGFMDYATILRRLDALAHDVTVYVEHFPYPETVAGQQYIREVAREIGVNLN